MLKNTDQKVEHYTIRSTKIKHLKSYVERGLFRIWGLADFASKEAAGRIARAKPTEAWLRTPAAPVGGPPERIEILGG